VGDPRRELVRYYRWLRRHGLNDSHSGNASVRDGDTVWVTPTGACADLLRPGDLVACRLGEPPPEGASLDAGIHLAVYEAAPGTGAVLHGHGPHATALSMGCGARLHLADFEGAYYFREGVPVVDVALEGYREQAPRRVAEALRAEVACLMRGHGIYARGETLERAYKWVCTVESAARVTWLSRALRGPRPGGTPPGRGRP